MLLQSQTRVENEDTIGELGQFDVITSRAFASLTDFVDAAQSLYA